MFAREEAGSLRFCIDYQNLNVMIVESSYLLLQTDTNKCTNSLQTANQFPALDADGGCWRIATYTTDLCRTALVTLSTLQSCTHLSFRLKNSLAVNQLMTGTFPTPIR